MPTLRVEVVPDSALQLRSALAKHVRQVFEVVASGETEFADKVLCGSFEIAVVFVCRVVFGSAEVCV
jgi:hypothetical protein